jgi:hypothetical protein
LVVLIAVLPGCAKVVREPVSTPDHSALSPTELLTLFLETERSRQAVKFSFKGQIEVEAGKRHEFRGYCGYTPCGSLRMKLLGPVGLTVLDYLNADGEVTLGVNHLTDEGDEEALHGLLTLLGNFTRSLVDRCRPADALVLESEDDRSVTFGLDPSADPSWSWTLDRSRGVVLAQATSGSAPPSLRFEWLDYGWDDGHWVPARIEVRREDSEARFAIHMDVRKWEAHAKLPARFFEP